jgi:hypothetical protein
MKNTNTYILLSKDKKHFSILTILNLEILCGEPIPISFIEEYKHIEIVDMEYVMSKLKEGKCCG